MGSGCSRFDVRGQGYGRMTALFFYHTRLRIGIRNLVVSLRNIRRTRCLVGSASRIRRNGVKPCCQPLFCLPFWYAPLSSSQIGRRLLQQQDPLPARPSDIWELGSSPQSVRSLSRLTHIFSLGLGDKSSKASERTKERAYIYATGGNS